MLGPGKIVLEHHGYVGSALYVNALSWRKKLIFLKTSPFRDMDRGFAISGCAGISAVWTWRREVALPTIDVTNMDHITISRWDSLPITRWEISVLKAKWCQMESRHHMTVGDHCLLADNVGKSSYTGMLVPPPKTTWVVIFLVAPTKNDIGSQNIWMPKIPSA